MKKFCGSLLTKPLIGSRRITMNQHGLRLPPPPDNQWKLTGSMAILSVVFSVFFLQFLLRNLGTNQMKSIDGQNTHGKMKTTPISIRKHSTATLYSRQLSCKRKGNHGTHTRTAILGI